MTQMDFLKDYNENFDQKISFLVRQLQTVNFKAKNINREMMDIS